MSDQDLSGADAAAVGSAGSIASDQLSHVDRCANCQTAHAWQPISTAPKEGRVLLRVPFEADGMYEVQIGQHDDAGEFRTPQPLWRYDLDQSETAEYSRRHPPSHWMPLPSPPLVDGVPE